MNFIADFHIHSKYSRATAKNLDFENLYITAQIKGITVVGSSDFTHPAWWREICEKLIPAEEGLFALKPDIARACDEKVPPSCRRPVRFMLVTEISNIYKKAGRTRKNHNIVFMPDLETAARFNAKLDKIGNIRSDGRPILGLDARHLLELVIEASDLAYLVPAHIWTPWFSLLGSKSGFDRVEECFEDLSNHIFALETGLSSDPPMNWRVSALDRFALISNSDAHSPAKLGREANLFDTELSYGAIREALKDKQSNTFKGTIEFFPEEGKYHVDGHRDCHFRCEPAKTRSLQNKCPVCGRPLVLGVLYRVQELADRPEGTRLPSAKPYESLIPLVEVLAEVFQTGPGAQRVQRAYDKLIQQYGSEFDILRHVPREILDGSGVALLGEAIARMRGGRVIFNPGYDGEYGTVCIFDSQERAELLGQHTLFDVPDSGPAQPELQKISFDNPQSSESNNPSRRLEPVVHQTPEPPLELNADQQRVVDHINGPLLVSAGPGTGKTRTITSRMKTLILDRGVAPESILAVTFTNKAAQEMRQRLAGVFQELAARPLITTFHGLCRQLLLERNPERPFSMLDEEARRSLVADVLDQVRPGKDGPRLSVPAAVGLIVEAKQMLLGPGDDLSIMWSHPAYAEKAADIEKEYIAAICTAYQQILNWQNLVDFEDLILETVKQLTQDSTWRHQLQQRFAHIFVDEFQDINYGQYQLIRLLAPAKANICVIGDPDQAIYGFRGSDVRYFKQFAVDYPNLQSVQLTRNYRSTETILEASFQVIRSAENRAGQSSQARTYSTLQGEKSITILEAATARAEAVAIGRIIEQLVGGVGFHAIDFGKVTNSGHEYSFSDFAILFRTSSQGALIAEVLRQAGIPCQFADKHHLLEQRAVAKLMALLRVVADQGTYADLNLLTDLTAPGISRETLIGFKRWAYANRLSLFQALNTAPRIPISVLSTARQQRLAALVRFVHNLKNDCRPGTVSETIETCIRRTTLANDFTSELLQPLLDQSQTFGKELAAFLSDQVLQSDTDLYFPEVEKVALMTMHAAKGLEFKIVFIAGCEAGLIPFEHPASQSSDLEEERRLFFVAMTRAKSQLYFSWARKRQLYGRTSEQWISPFVADVEQRLKKYSTSSVSKKRPVQEQLSLF